MKQHIIKLLKVILGDWSIFDIYYKKLPETSTEIDSPYNIKVSSVSPEQHKFNLMEGDISLCSLEILWGETYKKRGFITLENNEAKVISVETPVDYRGKGHAVRLLQYCEGFVAKEGIKGLYARIWHSNNSSISAFRKSGWAKHGTKISLKLFRVIPVTFYFKNNKQ